MKEQGKWPQNLEFQDSSLSVSIFKCHWAEQNAEFLSQKCFLPVGNKENPTQDYNPIFIPCTPIQLASQRERDWVLSGDSTDFPFCSSRANRGLKIIRTGSSVDTPKVWCQVIWDVFINEWVIPEPHKQINLFTAEAHLSSCVLFKCTNTWKITSPCLWIHLISLTLPTFQNIIVYKI